MPAPPSVAPALTDGTVTLRAISAEDIPAIVEQSTDAETVRWTTLWEGYTREDGREFVERTQREWATGERYTWAVDHDDRFAGLAGYRSRGENAVEISFATHPAHRGRGVITRAVRLALGHAFDSGAEVAFWHALVGNYGSRKVAWRLGFRISGPVTNVVEGAVREFWTGRLLAGEPMEPFTRWLTAPTIEGDGLRLRPFRDDDASSMPAEPDAAAAAYSAGLPTPESFAESLLAQRDRSAAGSALSIAVADAATDALLGGVDLTRLDVPLFAGTGILGYWLLPSARGGGASRGRALELVIPYAWRPVEEGGLGLHQLTAGCAAGNRASARVLRRAGFRLAGTERQAIQVSGRPDDALVFDLLADDDREAQRVEPGLLPVIETSRFRLRPWTEGDVPGPDEAPDAASLRFMPPGAHPDASSFPAWLRRRQLSQDADEHLDWAIADRETDHVLGNLTVFRLDPVANRFQAEIGYWLHPTARGKGVVPEVMPAIIDHAFAPVSEGGWASLASMQRPTWTTWRRRRFCCAPGSAVGARTATPSATRTATSPTARTSSCCRPTSVWTGDRGASTR